VLLDDVVAALRPKPGAAPSVLVDATAGRGGHAAALAATMSVGSTIVLNDLDAGNVEAAREVVEGAVAGRLDVLAWHGSLAALPYRLAEAGLAAHAVLADLGFSSTQMDDPARGFAFSSDGPLDMRYDQSSGPKAADLVARLPEADLEHMLREFGEEPRARKVARKLVEARADSPITTTGQLAKVVRSAAAPGGRIDAATRTFQALRIAVNDELGHLEGLLSAVDGFVKRGSPAWLAEGARVGVIAFHSLEDRRVKRAFGKLVDDGRARPIGEWPTRPGEHEVASNSRSRSARLRVIELV